MEWANWLARRKHVSQIVGSAEYHPRETVASYKHDQIAGLGRWKRLRLVASWLVTIPTSLSETVKPDIQASCSEFRYCSEPPRRTFLGDSALGQGGYPQLLHTTLHPYFLVIHRRRVEGVTDKCEYLHMRIAR
jgi:hypothetical protein